MEFLEDSNISATNVYKKSVEGIESFPNKLLGPNTSRIFYEDPKLLLFTLSRYKFVAKQFEGYKNILEIGCQEGFGAPIVSQNFDMYTGLDFYEPHISFARNNFKEFSDKFKFFHHDILLKPLLEPIFDCAFALDVLEHIEKDKEELFFNNIKKYLLQSEGPLILGMPSLESQKYASKRSKLGHVNCKSKNEFRESCKNHFKYVFMFSMNDEVLHTGYDPMSQYLFAICAGHK